MRLRRLLLPLAACALLVPAGAVSAAPWSPVPPAATTAPAAKPAPTIKSAARAYLHFVGPSNRVVDRMYRHGRTLSSYDLAGWKAQRHAQYLHNRHYISGLTRIRWPQSLRPIVNNVIRAAAAVGAIQDGQSYASTWYGFNDDTSALERAHRARRVAVSVLRANLGLPQVP
jgi:hypothetical protein